jgi:hypothetical protein
VFRSGGDSSGVFSASRASQLGQNRQLVLAHVSRIESRIALRGNYTLGGSQASENIALTPAVAWVAPVCTENLNADVVVMKSTKDRV